MVNSPINPNLITIHVCLDSVVRYLLIIEVIISSFISLEPTNVLSRHLSQTYHRLYSGLVKNTTLSVRDPSLETVGLSF